jgi:glucose-1-phosphate thymidylyltransferase
MKGVILAAGQGTRLRPVTLTMPKPLVPVANKALIVYAIDVLKEAGLQDIGIVVNDLKSPIVQQLGDGAQLGVHLEYIVQERQLGLAHAIGLARDFVGDDAFCVFLGDNIFQDKMTSVLRNFEASEANALISLREVGDPSRFGIAVLDDGHIKQVIEKPKEPPSNLAIVGIYLFRRSIFKSIDEIPPSGRNEYEITDAIQHLINSGADVRPYIIDGWWIDAGKPESILLGNQLVLGEIPYAPAPEDKERIVESEVSHRVILGSGSQIIGSVVRGPVIIGDNVIVRNSYIGPYTSLGDNVLVENSEIESSIVMRDCKIRNIVGRIDASVIADGSELSAATHVPAVHCFILAENSKVQL